MRTEDDVARALLPAAAVVVDTGAMVAAVRRAAKGRRRRRVVTAGVATVVVAAGVPFALAIPPAPNDAVAPLACTVQSLPVPARTDGFEVTVTTTGIDPAGRFVVGNALPAGAEFVNHGTMPIRSTALRWDNGTLTVIGEPDGDLAAADVNALGWVVGGGRLAEDAIVTGWVLRGGVLEPLPLPDGYGSAWASAINSSGQVAGGALAGGRTAAVVWEPGIGGGYVARVLPSDGDATAYGIADDGTVVGEWAGVPYAWTPEGEGRALPVPEDAASSGRAERVRGDWAAGRAGDDVVRWYLKTSSAVDSFESQDHAVAVNGRGDFAYVGDDGPVLVRQGVAYDLPRLPGLAEAELRTALGGLSDDGTVVAGSQSNVEPAWINQPVLWRCPS